MSEKKEEKGNVLGFCKKCVHSETAVKTRILGGYYCCQIPSKGGGTFAPILSCDFNDKLKTPNISKQYYSTVKKKGCSFALIKPNETISESLKIISKGKVILNEKDEFPEVIIRYRVAGLEGVDNYIFEEKINLKDLIKQAKTIPKTIYEVIKIRKPNYHEEYWNL